jgi:N-acetyl sugar amidotransferase
MKGRPYQICTRCVMDTSDPDIQFDENGVCNHCLHFDSEIKQMLEFEGPVHPQLEKKIRQIKKDGEGKEYDCIAGASGGVDSTYALYLMKQYGLRPLVVHLDNGWNSELAVKNIENIVRKLDFDLYTKVLDWEEFRNLQLAYLKASVIDLEALSDHAIVAILYKMASKHKLKWILAGTNYATEATLPDSWRYPDKGDAVNIKDINKRFGTKTIKSFPLMGFLEFSYYFKVKKITWLNFLNYFKYNKEEAKHTIIKELGWRDYGGKHYESIITKFYQGYILPVKFGVDKRRAHLATLIQSGQMEREEALSILTKPPLPETEVFELKEYVCKKLGISNKEFDDLMKLPIKSHYDYATDQQMRKFLFSLNRRLRKTN